MINLMPDYMRQEIIYARRNRTLLRWLFAMIIVIVGVGLMTLFGQYYINRSTTSLEASAKTTQDRIGAQNLATVQKEIKGLSNNFTTITQLLQRQLLFSKMFTKIGSIVPSGAILRGINLSTTTTSIDLNVVAVNREAATQAFVNISDPTNGLFEKADLISVGCDQIDNDSSEAAIKYPCSATIKVIIKTDSSFFFLNTVSNTTGNKN